MGIGRLICGKPNTSVIIDSSNLPSVTTASTEGFMHKHTTALYNTHLDYHAKLFTFCDWLMPLHFGSSLREHYLVRTDAGMFDLSCMTVIDVKGVDAKHYLQYVLSHDVELLVNPGERQYSCVLNENAGILDDL